MNIYKKLIPSKHKKLGRHILHDERSKDFKFDTSKLTLISATHARHIPILDQGDVGSCTGNAGIGAISTDPLYNTIPQGFKYSLNENGALRLYSDAEDIDGDGPYPPNDNGSYGLSIAKSLKNAGLIDVYQHTFSLNDALLALGQYPIMIGINWYDGMFNPAPDGRVRPTGSIAGGHEIVARTIDVVGQKVWFDNSWGTSWGVNGKFYLTFTDLGTLLSQNGDVIVLIPKGTTSSTTTLTTSSTTTKKPNSPEDVALASAIRNWLNIKGL